MPNKESTKRRSASSKKPKVPRRMLLIEPSADEEQKISRQRALSQCRLFDGHSNQETDKMAPSFKVSQNVIQPSGKTVKSKQVATESKKLIRLLTILFGTILTICLFASHNAQVTPNASTETTVSPIKQVFPIQNSSSATTQQPPVTTTLLESEEESASDATTTASPVTTTVGGAENLEGEDTGNESTEPPPSPPSASAEEEELEEPASGGGRSLDRKLLLESASDAADHLLARIKPDKAADDRESEGEDATNKPEDETPVEGNDISADRSTAEALTSDEQSDGNRTKIQNGKGNLEAEQLKYALEIYAKWRAAGDDIIELFSRKMLPVIVEHGYDVDSVTVTGLLQVFNGIRAIKPWALKLLDASAKISPGLLVGTQSDFGDFDECLNIREDDPSGLGADLTAEVDEETGLKSSSLVGRYCLADIEFPKPPRVRLNERNEELQTDYAPIELRRPLLNFSALEIYAKWRAAGDDIIELFSRKMLPVIVEHGYDVDSVTVTGLLQVFNGIRAIKPWALKLLDASAKISPGLLVGTQSDFGDFDECLNIREDDPSGLGADLTAEVDEETGLKSSSLVGRYCLADIEFPKPPRVRLNERNEELQTDYAPIELRRPLLNFSETVDFKGTIFVETANFFHMLYVDPIRVGVCLTNKIDPDSFAKVFNQLVKEFGVSINFHDRCVTKYDKPIWTTKQRVSAYILLVACSLVLVCTALDLLHSKLNKWPLPRSLDFWKKNLQRTLQRHRPLFTSFSVIRNTKRLFKAQQAPATRVTQTLANSSLLNDGSKSTTSSSSESSPSIERRSGSSPASSAMNLISGTSSELSGSSSGQFSVKTTNHLLAQFNHHQAVQRASEQKVISGSRHHEPRTMMKTDGREINLVCLHGIRVITMTWMIVNHTYLFGGFFVLWAHRRLIDIAEWPKSLSFQLVLNGWLTVETYFFLSAAIIVLNALPLMKARRFNYLTYILHRLVRLIPAYVGLVSLNFLWPLISSGPVWLVKGKSFIQTPCENYLWTNFLFINNWIWPEKQCMVHTWFLSADFQLYLLAPILVYLLYRRPVLGHTTNIIVAILASVFSGFVIYANKLMPTTLINKLEFDSIKQQLSYSYFATYQHMGPYCLGIFIGYLLYKRPNVKLPRHVTWILWILLPPLSFTTLLLTYLWNGAYDDPNLINPSPLVSALYVAIHRTIWTSLLAWIVFACATGRAKLMSNFLSHSMFIPLSRLSFSIYLVHLPVIMFRALNLRHTVEWTDTNILWEACGNFIASIVIGYFVNVTFESPIINLEQVIFGRPGERASGNPIKSGCKSGNLHLIAASAGGGGKLHDSSSLMPQLISVSKTSSDNGSSSDDNKSSNTSDQGDGKQFSEGDDQTSVMCDQTMTAMTETDDGFTTPTTDGSPQLPHHNHQRTLPWNSRGSYKVSMINHEMEPQSLAGGDNNAQPEQVPVKQPMAPTGVKPKRKVLTQLNQESPPPSDDSIGSSIYPISVSEYQNYLPRQQSGASSSADPRPTQYATLARTSRFKHDQPAGPVDRMEQQRQLYYPSKSRSHLGGSISSTHGDGSLKSPSRQGTNYRQGHSHLRRQSRYNTLTGLGSREWRRDYAASLSRLDSSQPDWHSGSGWMIPRVDSATLRRGAKRNEQGPAGGSIIEEHEDVGM